MASNGITLVWLLYKNTGTLRLIAPYAYCIYIYTLIVPLVTLILWFKTEYQGPCWIQSHTYYCVYTHFTVLILFCFVISCSICLASINISITQIHNDDGVWLRLSHDSIREYCTNGHIEGWVLQYNQHLGKTLLVPVEEPKSITKEIIKETIRRNLKAETSKHKRG